MKSPIIMNDVGITTEDLIEVNDYEVDLTRDSVDYLKILELRDLHWHEEAWKPSGAWLHSGADGLRKVKGTVDQPLQEQALLDLGLTDQSELQFVEGGWTLDVCQVCSIELFETDDDINGRGWRSGDMWVCDECHRLFVGKEAVFAGKFPE